MTGLIFIMKLKNIIDALTLWHFKSNKETEPSGFFLSKEVINPTRINAYKEYIVEIYYHIPHKNIKVFTFKATDKCLEGQQEAFKESCLTALLEQLFTNLNSIENEIIQNGRI